MEAMELLGVAGAVVFLLGVVGILVGRGETQRNGRWFVLVGFCVMLIPMLQYL